MHASPPALIDACMSFKIAQLQEVRTAPAAHGDGGWQEGPVTFTPPPWLLPSHGLGGGRVAVERNGPSAGFCGDPWGYAVRAGNAAHDGRDDGRRWNIGAYFACPARGAP
jgi:hypothetical protein